jgi:UrcA family protein
MQVRPLILSALAAAMAIATVPSAAMAEQTNRSSVSYSDLDLSTEAGRTELAKRFDQAARDMCGVSDEASLKGKTRYCYETNSKSMKSRVAMILSKHDEARGG